MPSRRILVGVDDSPAAAAAVAWCAAMAKGLDATVFAVHAASSVGYLAPSSSPAEIPPIIEDPSVEESVHHELEHELEGWCAVLRDADVPYQSRVFDGSVIDVLLQAADEIDADLVVVGHRKHGALKEKLMGSVPNQLTHHCGRPVVVVPVP